MEILKRISINPEVMGGKPCIKGTRLTIDTIIGLLNSDVNAEDIITMYPYLCQEDIEAAQSYNASSFRKKVFEDITEAVIELNLILTGNNGAKDANELLNDL